jgi:hypothetical protein
MASTRLFGTASLYSTTGSIGSTDAAIPKLRS